MDYVYVRRGVFKDTLLTVSRENQRIAALRPFPRLAGYGAMSMMAEAGSYGVTMIPTGLLGVLALDSNAVIDTIDA